MCRLNHLFESVGMFSKKVYSIILLFLIFFPFIGFNNSVSDELTQSTENSITEQPVIITKTDNDIKEPDFRFQEEKVSNYLSLKTETTSYEDHSRIEITGNADFYAQAVSGNWSGNGTSADPFVIDGYFIDEEPSVKITDTNVSFQVSNCLVKDIDLNNVNNSYIHNNTIYFILGGFSMENSYNNSIYNNTIFSDITLGYSDHNSILNNVNKHDGGIRLVYSNHNIVSENLNFIDQGGRGGDGIRLGSSNHNFVSRNFNSSIYLGNSINNTCFNNSLSFLSLDSSRSNRIINNQLNNQTISIHGSNISDYIQTEVSGNTVNGRQILYWENVSNVFTPSDVGGYIFVNCKNVSVVGQTLFGGFQAYCSNLNLFNNTFYGGLISLSSDYISFAGNVVEGPIYLRKTNNSILTENIRIGRKSRIKIGAPPGGAIIVHFSKNVSLIKNTVKGYLSYSDDGGNSGVVVEASSNILISNNTIGPFTSPGGFEIGIRIGDLAGFTPITYIAILGNSIIGNYVGIRFPCQVIDSKIFLNNFIDNNIHSRYPSGTGNFFVFNFWDNWRSPDVNGDGVVDDPYLIDDNGFDYFPLVDPVIDISSYLPLPPRVILPSREEVLISEPLLLSWIPALDLLGSSISYSIFYSVDTDTLDWVLLASQLIETEFLWDFNSTLRSGMVFRIKVEAMFAEGFTADYITDAYLIVDNFSSSSPVALELILGGLIIFIVRRRKRKGKLLKNTKINE